MMRASQTSQRGMSLIEMMIACVVLMVGVLAMAAQLDSHRADAHGKNIERAPGSADTDALRLYGCVNDDHCLGIADGVRRDAAIQR